MIDAGDIYVADVNDEVRRPVLAVSADRFHRLADQAFVVPQISTDSVEDLFPWRIEVGGAVYAVDRMRSIATTRLFERTGRATLAEMNAVRRAIRHLTN